MSIKTKDWKIFLKSKGLKHIRTNSSHEVWSKKDLKRPIIFPNTKKDLKDSLIRSNLRTLNLSYEDFENARKNKFKF